MLPAQPRAQLRTRITQWRWHSWRLHHLTGISERLHPSFLPSIHPSPPTWNCHGQTGAEQRAALAPWAVHQCGPKWDTSIQRQHPTLKTTENASQGNMPTPKTTEKGLFKHQSTSDGRRNTQRSSLQHPQETQPRYLNPSHVPQPRSAAPAGRRP